MNNEQLNIVYQQDPNRVTPRRADRGFINAAGFLTPIDMGARAYPQVNGHAPLVLEDGKCPMQDDWGLPD